MNTKVAVILVDIQNDFCSPNGALSVQNATDIIPEIKARIEASKDLGEDVLYVFTQDAHPLDHCSFKENGGEWPQHCVVDTWGYDLYPEIEDILVNLQGDQIIRVMKATEPDKDAYSAFDGTGLEDILRNENVDWVIVCGLATDFCVKATALDAVRHGFDTTVFLPGIRGVFLKSTQEAMIEMAYNGIQFEF